MLHLSPSSSPPTSACTCNSPLTTRVLYAILHLKGGWMVEFINMEIGQHSSIFTDLPRNNVDAGTDPTNPTGSDLSQWTPTNAGSSHVGKSTKTWFWMKKWCPQKSCRCSFKIDVVNFKWLDKINKTHSSMTYVSCHGSIIKLQLTPHVDTIINCTACISFTSLSSYQPWRVANLTNFRSWHIILVYYVVDSSSKCIGCLGKYIQ